MSLGPLLRERRLNLEAAAVGTPDEGRFSLRQVADRIGISGSYLSKLERGLKTRPSYAVLQRIAREYRLPGGEVVKQAGSAAAPPISPAPPAPNARLGFLLRALRAIKAVAAAGTEASGEYTVKSVAARVGVSAGYLGEIERGTEARVSAEVRESMAREYGVSPDLISEIRGPVTDDLSAALRSQLQRLPAVVHALSSLPELRRELAQ